MFYYKTKAAPKRTLAAIPAAALRPMEETEMGIMGPATAALEEEAAEPEELDLEPDEPDEPDEPEPEASAPAVKEAETEAVMEPRPEVPASERTAEQEEAVDLAPPKVAEPEKAQAESEPTERKYKFKTKESCSSGEQNE